MYRITIRDGQVTRELYLQLIALRVPLASEE